MTKKDIREGLEELIFNSWDKPIKSADLAYDIMAYFDSQGVVLKAEGELPEPRYPYSEVDAYIWEGQQDMLKAGYVKTERLI